MMLMISNNINRHNYFLGLKGKILKMILSYNTLWLRIGLEVI